MAEDMNTEKTVKKVQGIPFKKGDDPRRNTDGRPPGALNFATKFRVFVEKVAENKNITPEEVEEQLLSIGYDKAQEGNYNFWRDLHDRVYGQATQNVNVEAKLEINEEAREKAKRALRDI
jgi:hypothetical protein